LICNFVACFAVEVENNEKEKVKEMIEIAPAQKIESLVAGYNVSKLRKRRDSKLFNKDRGDGSTAAKVEKKPTACA
jgi:hypothetical protein